MSRFGVVRAIFELALIALVVFLAVSRPTGGIRWRQDVVYRVRTQQKVVALTFDDGPHPTFTPKLLDVLDHYHVKATFLHDRESHGNVPANCKGGGRARACDRESHLHAPS